MLVTFRSKCYGDVTMFGDVATTLLKMMGHSGTVPGAILAEDISAALARLEQGLQQVPPKTRQEPVPSKEGEQESEEEPIGLANRAFPLIEMLKTAAQQNCAVMWDS